MKQIWAKNLRDEKNVAMVFDYSFVPSKDAELRIACNVAFRVKIDGEMIGYGPRRMAHGKAAVNSYSLAKFADKLICIEVEAVSYRVTNFYIVNQSPFFAAEVVSGGKVIANSFDFKAYRNESKLQKVQRYSYTRGFTESYNIDGKHKLTDVETDEREVCALCDCCAPYPIFDTLYAKTFASGEVYTKQNFTEYDDTYINRRNTPHFEREEQEYRISLVCDALGFKCTDSAGEMLSREYRTYKLERNATGFIAFDAEVTESADLLIEYDEILSKGEDSINIYRTDSISAIDYKLSPGKYSLMAFEPDSMQYIRFAVLEGRVKLSNVRLITYENGEVIVTLGCEDADLNLMFEAAVNSFKPNAVDLLTDCPSRERAGWLCDSYFTGRAEKVLTGDNKAERNLIRAYRDYPEGVANIPPNVFPMCYPCDHITPNRYIPNWCMWFVLELESYLARSGDRVLIDELKDKICAYLDYTLRFLNADGLLENLEGWVFVEWSRANDFTDGVNYPTNMLFSAALKAAHKMYGVQKYADIAKRADAAILRQSYDGCFFADNAVRDGNGNLVRNHEHTETCQYYAFTFGYASEKGTPELYKIIFEEISGYCDVSDKYPDLARSDSFIGLYLRLDYLCATGKYDKLVEDMKKYFLLQAKETKTFWEYKDAHGSCCHGFASIMCEWILKAVERV